MSKPGAPVLLYILVHCIGGLCIWRNYCANGFP